MPALVLTGNLKIGPSTGVEDTDSGTANDVSSEVLHFKISGMADTIEVPATLTTPIHGRGGAADYAIEIGYLSNDITASQTLFNLLWSAITTTGSAILYFEGSMKSGSVSTTNPEWSGNFVVTEATVGAAAEQLSQGSATFPMTGPPTMETT